MSYAENALVNERKRRHVCSRIEYGPRTSAVYGRGVALEWTQARAMEIAVSRYIENQFEDPFADERWFGALCAGVTVQPCALLEQTEPDGYAASDGMIGPRLHALI